MDFVEVAGVAIQLAQRVKGVCDKVKSNKDKCGLLAKLSDEVGALLQSHFGDSQKASKWKQDKVVFGRIETIRFCLKNAEDLIQNYSGMQGFGMGLVIFNAMNIGAKFQKVIDDLKDAERQLVQAISVDAAANQGDSSEVVAKQRHMQEFLEAAERDRQRDAAAIQDQLKANGGNNEELQQQLKVVIELFMKQTAVGLNSSPSTPSSSTRVSSAAGSTDTDHAYFITPDCIEYEQCVRKNKGDRRVKLGQGGFGTVYKAKLRRSLPVAVKVLDDSATNKAALDELRREIRIMSSLSHPNIICFLGGYYPTTQSANSNDDDDEAYLVMELAENKSLAYHLGMVNGASVQELSMNTKMKVLSGLADGLYYLHMQKIVHRDIKPDNVLLDRDFVAKLSDFGLAKVKETSVSSRSHAGAVGTLGYQSPETMRSEKPSFAADIWSFGIVMLECVINERVYAGGHMTQVYEMVCVNKKAPLEKLKPYESQWPKEYLDLIRSCLRYDVKNRPTAMDTSMMMRGIVESFKTVESSTDDDNATESDGNVSPTVSGVASLVSTFVDADQSEDSANSEMPSSEEIEELFQRGRDFVFGTNGTQIDYARAAGLYRLAAAQGHAEAQYNLGAFYSNGYGVAQDYEQAFAWWQLAANQGLAQAELNLGYCYENGQGVAIDDEEAVKWYQLAAIHGNADAQHNLGTCYENGRGVTKDLTEAKKWYRLAADQGDEDAKQALSKLMSPVSGPSSPTRSIPDPDTPEASKPETLSTREVEELFTRGVEFYSGNNGAKIDYARAVECFRKAADHGHAEAQCSLGDCYANGWGVEQDWKQAVHWYRLAAYHGNAGGLCNLGFCYKNGWGVEQDYKQAVEWYRWAANEGNAGAQCTLGHCYKNGWGVEQDSKQAVEWYRLAANQGDADGQINIGECYKDGQGVAKDLAEAKRWYKLAADQGNVPAKQALSGLLSSVTTASSPTRDFAIPAENAPPKLQTLSAREIEDQFQRGLDFDFGRNGTSLDYTRAVEHYRKAADHGHAKAQSNLGVCYKFAQGVAQDYKKAVEWYRSAADQGLAQAQFNLGVCFENGQGVRQDYSQAVKWYLLAANQGDADAQNNLANCYQAGQGVAKDLSEAMKWYQLAANQGNDDAKAALSFLLPLVTAASSSTTRAGSIAPKSKTLSAREIEGLFQRGEDFYFGKNGAKTDYIRAVDFHRQAADQGHAEAQFSLGVCYENGRGVAQDCTKAVDWYRLAALQGYSQAQYKLGNCYHKGKGVAEDLAEARKWYKLAADQGNGHAKQALSRELSLGGTTSSSTRDIAMPPENTARKLQTLSARENEDLFQRAKNFYFGTNGVSTDYSRAVEYFRQAADQGHTEAQFCLGVCCEHGQGMEQDYKQAVEWYELAANQGHVQAQFNLGVCYQYGKGVARDTTEAKVWYQLAADQGDGDARSALSTMKWWWQN